jgi:hypothetical protein
MLAYWSMQEVAHCATASTEAWQGEPLHAGKAVIGPVDVGASDWATAGATKARTARARFSVNFIFSITKATGS